VRLGRTTVLAAAAMLAVTACGSASGPPKRSLVFDPIGGSLGGVHINDPMTKLVGLLGRPDRVVRLDGTPISLWLRGKALCTMWAQASPQDAHSKLVVYIAYRGPLSTSRGDRLGTPLAEVRRHWRSGWQLVDVTGGQGPNYGRVTHFGSAAFGFDRKRRLGGVSLQTSEQTWQPIVMPPCR
jgi:hypothetical protein